MSLNFANVQLIPNPVSTGAKFIISVEVWNDEFEFGDTDMKYNILQGFADEAQTIGGKLVELPIPENALLDCDNAYLRTVDGEWLSTI